MKKENAIIYQAANGAIELRKDADKETIWANQKQMADIFTVQRQAITKHLKNIFNEEELDEDSVSSILEHTASDGKKYKTLFYNLEVLISVGYRISSITGTKFRQRATSTLKQKAEIVALKSRIDATDREIDDMVFELYGMSEEEW